MDYVKHSTFPHSSLHGKKVAWCEDCLFRPGLFQVGKVRDDGFHELAIIRMEEAPLSDSGNRSMLLQTELPMNQDSVNKIVVPEAGSQLCERGFLFAVVQDTKSEILVKSGHNQKPT